MFDADSGLPSLGLEADLNLSVVDVVAHVAVEEDEAQRRFPNSDAPAIEYRLGVVVELEPASTDAGFDPDAHRAEAIVPILRTWPPPAADLLGENGKGRPGVKAHVHARRRHAAFSHTGLPPPCGRSA